MFSLFEKGGDARMTKVIIQSDDEWVQTKIQDIITEEIRFLRHVFDRTQQKLQRFEQQYGPLRREMLYGKVDDMELVEWEGELETVEHLQDHIHALEEMSIEYQ